MPALNSNNLKNTYMFIYMCVCDVLGLYVYLCKYMFILYISNIYFAFLKDKRNQNKNKNKKLYIIIFSKFL